MKGTHDHHAKRSEPPNPSDMGGPDTRATLIDEMDFGGEDGSKTPVAGGACDVVLLSSEDIAAATCSELLKCLSASGAAGEMSPRQPLPFRSRDAVMNRIVDLARDLASEALALPAGDGKMPLGPPTVPDVESLNSPAPPARSNIERRFSPSGKGWLLGALVLIAIGTGATALLPSPGNEASSPTMSSTEPRASRVEPNQSSPAQSVLVARAATTAPSPKVCGAGLNLITSPARNTRTAAQFVREAQAAQDAGDFRAAERHLCRALEEDSGHLKAYRDLALLYVHTARAALARDVAQAGLGLDPGSASLNKILGDAETLAGRISTARSRLARAFELRHDDATHSRAVARHFSRQAELSTKARRHARAARLYRRAFVFDAKNAEHAARAAHASLSAGHPQLAKDWAERALELDAKHALARSVVERAKGASTARSAKGDR